MRKRFDFLLLGGGLASASAAEMLRAEGATGSVAIVGAEPHLPYHRPALSKSYLLRGIEVPPVLTQTKYRQLGIQVFSGTRALAVDPQAHEVVTDQAGTLAYGKLLIATGARPVTLAVPGAALAGIHTLRRLEDAAALREAAVAGTHALVIGASFIGMEVASALCQRGVRVTLLAHHNALFDTLHDATISRFFDALYAAHGVEIVADDVDEFVGQAHVEGARLRRTGQLACDFVVVGIGVEPEVEFLQGSGIAVDGGVTVDRLLRANVPDVFAAGDAACYLDPVFNTHRRVEHWDHAVKQGRLAARNMLGGRFPYDEVSAFYSEVFNVRFQFMGMVEGADDRVELGDSRTGSWAVMYLRDQVPRALFTCGRPAAETQSVKALIRYRTNVSKLRPRMAQPDFSLAGVPSQTVLILQGGGALGAFEAGVVKALEQQRIHPDIVAGVSIGAFNGAIIASHPRHAAEALEAFWQELSVVTPPWPDDRVRRFAASLHTMMFGIPTFFVPRWWTPGFFLNPNPAAWTSLYDTSPALRLLEKYVDFKGLRTSPVRLLMSAVQVESGELKIFDSYVDDLGPEHVLASGSLPPGLPWTPVDGRHYWDGGIVSNSPLEQVVERCGASGKRILVVDLFAQRKPLPLDMAEVLTRRDEIVYAERVRRTGHEHELAQEFRKLVDDLLSHIDTDTAARLRGRPRYIELMGAEAEMDILRIVRESAAGMPASQDLDFSGPSIRANLAAGHAAALRTLRHAKRRQADAG